MYFAAVFQFFFLTFGYGPEHFEDTGVKDVGACKTCKRNAIHSNSRDTTRNQIGEFRKSHTSPPRKRGIVVTLAYAAGWYYGRFRSP